MKATLLFTLTLLLGFACFLTIGTAQTYVHHKTLLETDEGFKALAFSPDGTLLASGGFGGADNIYLHNPETGRLMHTLRGHTNTVNEVAFSPDGNLLASISRDTTVKLWNPQTGRLIRTLEGHPDRVYAVAFSPTGTLITGDRGGEMFRWTPAVPGEHRLVRRGTGRRVITAAYSSTGDFAIGYGNSGDRRFGISVWAPGNDPQDPNRISSALHIDQQDWVHCVAFAATGELVSGSEDNTVSIFPPNSLRASKILRGHTQKVYWVDVSASGTIASASLDGTVRLWNLATGQHVATLDEHTNSVNTVAFSPNEKWLASGSADGTVRLWQRSGTGVTQVVQTPQTGGGGGTVQPTNGWLATVVPSIDGKALDTGSSPIAVDTGETIDIIVSVTRNGRRLRKKAVLLSVEGGSPTLSKSEGISDDNGQVPVTLKLGANEGTFKFIVKAEGEFVGEDAFTIGELSFTATEGPGADADSLKVDYPKTLEPRLGNGDGRFTLTFTVKTPAKKPVVGAAIDVDRMSGPQIEDMPPRPRTDAQGVATLPLRLKDSNTGTLKFRVTVIGSRKELIQTHSITVQQTLAKVVLSSIPSKIDSGDSVSVTATAYSVNNTPVRGASITFSTSSASKNTLRFTRTSDTTGSSGRVSTTLQTKGWISGKWRNVGSSSAYYEPDGSWNVSVSASHKGITKSDSDSVAVVPVKKRGQDDFEVVSEEATCSRRIFGKCVWWRAKSQRSWSDYASFPSTVLYIVDVEGEMSWGDRLLGATAYIDGQSIDGTTVDVWGTIETHYEDPNNYFVTVTADYQATASSFGGSPSAPSWHSQFNPETQQLSTFWQDLSQVPEKTALLPNYPNPFNPETWIPYQLSETAAVTVTIHASDGKLVRTLELGQVPAGIYQNRSRAAYWDGRNAQGEPVASGIYFYTFTAGEFSATRKMVIRK